MKKLIISILSLIVFVHCALTQTSDVMLQGFAWLSCQNAATNRSRWTDLNNQAAEIGTYFDMIWLPPSSNAEGGNTDNNMGYHPRLWNSQASTWGTQQELKTLIQSLHDNGVKVLADIVVNHRAGNSWNTFPADNYGTDYTSYQLTYEHICKDDEAGTNGYQVGNNYDYNWNVSGDLWGGYAAARDLDHSAEYVRNAVKEYLKFLKNNIGYDGWRFDLTKGYRPQYAKEYAEAHNAYFAVGEYWSGDVSKLRVWVLNAGKSVSTFDFANKYAINAWNGGTNYSALVENVDGVNRPKGLIQGEDLRQYAVTFVDNHDTHPPHENPQQYTGDIPKAYAYLLSNPGVPCVFWTHWNSNKTVIKQQIAARKSVGLNSNSDVTVTNTSGYYESHTIGTSGELICRIGSWSAGVPDGYTTACSGSGWAYYTKINPNSNQLIMDENRQLTVYPNPAGDFIVIDGNEIVGDGSKLLVEIFDINGKQLSTTSYNVLQSPTKISVAALKSGIYYIKIGDSVGRFVKK
ncbi:hypothetical protein FACS1894178_7550 [Bacteroidia bacterium]|nr:hypothetical protein FACS1894178_7550 [Bacteroidia bacterium]